MMRTLFPASHASESKRNAASIGGDYIGGDFRYECPRRIESSPSAATNGGVPLV